MNKNSEPLHTFRKDAGMAILAMLFLGLPSLAVLYSAFAGGFDSTLLLIGFGLFAFTALVVATSHQARVLIFPDRLVHQTLFGRKEVKFNEQTRFYHRSEQHSMNGVPTSTHNYLTLDDGIICLELDSEICDQRLRDLVMDYELAVTLPATVKAYGNGQLINFGVVRLQAGTLHYKKNSIPLGEITKMTLNAGKFAVYSGKDKVFFKIDVFRIANMLTLFHLLEKLTGPRI